MVIELYILVFNNNQAYILEKKNIIYWLEALLKFVFLSIVMIIIGFISLIIE